MKKILLFSLITILVASILTGVVFFSLCHQDKRALDTIAEESGTKNFILAGLDDAGDNTDMLMLVSIGGRTGGLSFMQIPRDTYLRMDGREGKINQLYHYYSSEYGTKDAADHLLDAFSNAFSLPIHGYVIFRMQAVEETVDAIGGIPMTLAEDFVYLDEETGKEKRIAKGERVLDGRDAGHYIRHRASYAEGDLGRLDAQLRFFSSAFTSLARLKSPVAYLRLYQKIVPKLLTNLSEKDIISLVTVFIKNRDGSAVRLMRLPGEATRGNSGSWYYVVNRKETERLLTQYFTATEGYRFDADGRFVRSDRESFMNIYGDPSHKSRVYTLREAAEIKVIKK